VTYSNLIPQDYTDQAQEAAYADLWGEAAWQRFIHSVGTALVSAACFDFEGSVLEPLRESGFGQ
jgi:hypothetical protein